MCVHLAPLNPGLRERIVADGGRCLTELLAMCPKGATHPAVTLREHLIHWHEYNQLPHVHIKAVLWPTPSKLSCGNRSNVPSWISNCSHEKKKNGEHAGPLSDPARCRPVYNPVEWLTNANGSTADNRAPTYLPLQHAVYALVKESSESQ